MTVQINVEDEEDSLSANESVTVVFGMTDEDIEQLQHRQSQSMQGRPDDVSGGNAMPQGGPGGGEKPQSDSSNGELPENGEMPRGASGNGEFPGNDQQGGQTQS